MRSRRRGTSNRGDPEGVTAGEEGKAEALGVLEGK